MLVTSGIDVTPGTCHVSQVILRTFVDAYMPEEVKGIVESTIEATLELYSTLLQELLPTPAKSHYTFNLRDIASVVQGMLSAHTKPGGIASPADFIRLCAPDPAHGPLPRRAPCTWCTAESVRHVGHRWAHENLRVFRDRLVNNDDRSWCDADPAHGAPPTRRASHAAHC